MSAGSTQSLNIHLINLFPQAVGPFNIGERPKDWATPIGFSDLRFINPDFPDFYIFPYLALDNTGQPVVKKFQISVVDAQRSNPIAGVNLMGQTALAPYPTPIDDTKIPTGYKIGLNLMKIVSLIPINPVDDTSVGSGLTQEEHNALMEILAFVRK